MIKFSLCDQCGAEVTYDTANPICECGNELSSSYKTDYVYKCKSCNKKVEVNHESKFTKNEKRCPTCKSVLLRVFIPTSVWKGASSPDAPTKFAKPQPPEDMVDKLADEMVSNINEDTSNSQDITFRKGDF